MPLEEEAARLDGEIANARKDAAELTRRSTASVAAVDAAASAQESTSRLAELEKQLRQVGGELRSHGAARLLAEQWPTVEGDLPKRDALRRDSETRRVAGKHRFRTRPDRRPAGPASAGIAEIRDQAEALRERAAQKASALKRQSRAGPGGQSRPVGGACPYHAGGSTPACRCPVATGLGRADAARRGRCPGAPHGGRTIGSGEALRGTRRRGADQLLFDLAEAAYRRRRWSSGPPWSKASPVRSAVRHAPPGGGPSWSALKLRKAAIDAQIEEAERLEAALGQAAAARSRQGVTEEQVATHRSEMVEARQAYGRSRALFLADRRQKDRDLAASADPDPVATESLIAMIDERRAACRERLKASSALRQERDQLVEAAEG